MVVRGEAVGPKDPDSALPEAGEAADGPACGELFVKSLDDLVGPAFGVPPPRFEDLLLPWRDRFSVVEPWLNGVIPNSLDVGLPASS